ncbi:exodeoxyribonuclease V subunit gamma [Shewanella cyperi]|uniref:exodeoxyribonuclease V subunit gamma n=1 Tax=Shewanella cyperi TaxID=2814292 RepID=UPI001A93EA5A|nr:exodeoxyribonuclease V subunit gamma [Shewanella cyperi]QSX42342.1 exodeoxyribonuclease V subunit gamma [Shewanella cyperi]
MFRLIQSNQMEVLSSRLADLVRFPAPGSPPLGEEQILVQSPGMATWLRLELAAHNGIAAALAFPLPSSFIWSLCHTLLPGVPMDNAFTKEAMTWKLMQLLPGLLDADTQGLYQPLGHYLAAADTQDKATEQTSQPLKLYQLAGRIADIFDQYLVYRPDWILAWESGQDNPLPDGKSLPQSALWQPALWRQLQAFNNKHLRQSRWHRANLHQSLLEALADPNTSLAGLPKRLFVFGISSMAPQTLEVLHALAGRIDVLMFNLSPCRQYWGDIVDPRQRARLALKYGENKLLPEHWEDSLEVGNPLLAANGKMGRELLDLILSLPEQHLDTDEALYVEPGQDCLLHLLQQDILEMQILDDEPLGPDLHLYQQAAKRRPLRPDDSSLCIRSCHSPLREVETLHDHLLALLATDEGLTPKDIVVMLPDVAAYAPYIDAVFSSRRGDHAIPYAIADRGAREESPLVNSFLTALDLDNSRFGLSDILGMLEVPAVMARWRLDEDELARIRQWLRDAGVRWGRDGASRERLALPAFDKHSWAFGVRRLILGYALGDDSELYLGNLPMSGIEGQQAQALGKLLDFIEMLDEFRLSMAKQARAPERLALLAGLLEQLYQDSDDSRDDLQLIRECLGKLSDNLSGSGFDQELPLAVMAQYFRSELGQSRVGQRFLSGAVNFCTLMPMRSIPFQVVCLLGMNDGLYPRVQHPVGFDLMAQLGPRRGDRSRRLDDRYLFLEALLSARRQCYISYIGHSERDNSERLPSMLVSELLDCCELSVRPAHLPLPEVDDAQMASDFADRCSAELWRMLVWRQPLQPFDERLYRADDQSLTPSFSPQWYPQALATAKDRLPFVDIQLTADADEWADALPLAALIRFYRDSSRFYCQRRLKLDLRLDLEQQEDEEPFALNALERYQLQLLLMDTALTVDEDQAPEALADLGMRLGASGQLPMAPFDGLLLTDFSRDVAPAIERCRFLFADAEPDTLALELNLPSGQKLSGRIDRLYPKGMVNFRPGTAKAKDLLALYLRHLCLCAAGRSAPSFLLDSGHFHSLSPLLPEMALTLLDSLVAHYRHAATVPLAFFPGCSLEYAQAEGDHETRLAAVAPIWLDEQGGEERGEGTEPHNRRLFRFPDDFSEAGFGQLALDVYTPLLALYHKDKLAALGDFVRVGPTTGATV